MDTLGNEQQPLKREPQPERVIEVNEWFAPFPTYDVMAYEILGEKNKSKQVNVQIANIGRFEVSLYWDQGYFEDLGKEDESDSNRFLVLLPNGEEKFSASEVLELLSKLDNKLMRLEIESLDPSHQGKKLPFNLEIESPSGEIFSSQLSNSSYEEREEFRRISGSKAGTGRTLIPKTDEWVNNKKPEETISSIFLPEDPKLISGTKIRFVPRE
jgi:hypothetical protein